MRRTAALLSVGILMIGAPTLTAQVAASSACSYESCAIRYTAGFMGEHLLRGAESERALKISFSGGNAADYLSRVESAIAPAREFESRRTRAAVLGILGAAAAAYFVFRTYDDAVEGISASPTSTDYAVLWAGVGVSIFAGLEASRSKNALSKAIWEFNRAPVR